MLLADLNKKYLYFICKGDAPTPLSTTICTQVNAERILTYTDISKAVSSDASINDDALSLVSD